eukprot:7638877-Lingulodinium_polyedra.AAC.1
MVWCRQRQSPRRVYPVHCTAQALSKKEKVRAVCFAVDHTGYDIATCHYSIFTSLVGPDATPAGH